MLRLCFGCANTGYLFTGEISFWYSKYLRPWNIHLLQKLLKSSNVVVVSVYTTFCGSMTHYDRGPTNHILSRSKLPQNSLSHRDIVFWYVEYHGGLGYVFQSCRRCINCISHLKSKVITTSSLFAPTNISPWRLCPCPPYPITGGKLRVSAFFMCY